MARKICLIYLSIAINIFIIPNLLFVKFSHAQENIILKLENAYKNINDAMGSFVQISYIKDLDKIQKFSGRFFIKGDRLRWQYSGEFPQIIYINRETLTVYDKTRKQAIQSSFSPEKYGQLPLALLSRMAVIEKDFEITQKTESNLILVPKSKMGNIKKIELILHDENFPIKSMKVTDSNDNTVKIDFNSIKINTNLKDSIFKFTPKKDDTVLKYEKTSPIKTGGE